MPDAKPHHEPATEAFRAALERNPRAINTTDFEAGYFAGVRAQQRTAREWCDLLERIDAIEELAAGTSRRTTELERLCERAECCRTCGNTRANHNYRHRFDPA
jgi:hypothetical protein